MKFPIYLHKTDKGTFSGFVPDIDGCFFAGDNIDATIDDAYASIDAHLECLVEEGDALPEAKDISAHFDDEDCQGGVWAYADIDLSKYDGKAIKLNITLPQNLLNRIDTFVDVHKEYKSRSGFIAEIARRELAKIA